MMKPDRLMQSHNKMRTGIVGFAGLLLLATACTSNKPSAKVAIPASSDSPRKSVHAPGEAGSIATATSETTTVVLTTQPIKPSLHSTTVASSPVSKVPTSTLTAHPTPSATKIHALTAHDIPTVWSMSALVAASSINRDQVTVEYDYGVAQSGKGAYKAGVTNLPAGDGDLGKPGLPMVLACEGTTLVGQSLSGALVTFAGNIACADGKLMSNEAVYLPRPHQLNSNIY